MQAAFAGGTAASSTPLPDRDHRRYPLRAPPETGAADGRGDPRSRRQKGTSTWAVSAALDRGCRPRPWGRGRRAVALDVKDQRVAGRDASRRPDAAAARALGPSRCTTPCLPPLCAYAQGLAVIAGGRAQARLVTRLRHDRRDLARRLHRPRPLPRRMRRPTSAPRRAQPDARRAASRPARSARQAGLREAVASPPVRRRRAGLGLGARLHDGYRAARLPASLIQAQRDYFGARTYERVDRQGSFHRMTAPCAASGHDDRLMGRAAPAGPRSASPSPRTSAQTSPKATATIRGERRQDAPRHPARRSQPPALARGARGREIGPGSRRRPSSSRSRRSRSATARSWPSGRPGCASSISRATLPCSRRVSPSAGAATTCRRTCSTAGSRPSGALGRDHGRNQPAPTEYRPASRIGSVEARNRHDMSHVIPRNRHEHIRVWRKGLSARVQRQGARASPGDHKAGIGGCVEKRRIFAWPRSDCNAAHHRSQVRSAGMGTHRVGRDPRRALHYVVNRSCRT